MNGPDAIPCPLRELAQRRPGGDFLCLPDRTLSFAVFEELVMEGGAEGLRVAEGSTERVVSRLIRQLRDGGVLVLANDRQPPSVREEQVRRIREEWREDPAPHAENTPVWRLTRPATLMFTSGSGGKARAIVHSAGNHWASAGAANAQAPLGADDRWLCNLPLYHVGGLAIVFRCLRAGAAVSLPDPDWSVAEAVRRMRPTRLSLVPTQLRRWLRDPDFNPSGIRRVLMGGAPLPPELAEEALDRGVPLAASYGMTETSSQVAATPPGEPVRGSGRPLPHAEIRIASDGEILVRGPSVAMGEWTGEGIRPLTDADGWLHTRDAGRMEQNLLSVEGRMDWQFISGGENIQPEEIERALTALPGIGEAVVVPVEDPDFGHRPGAWVDTGVTPERAGAWNRALRHRLPGYLIPVGYRTLPEAGGLKRDRRALTDEW